MSTTLTGFLLARCRLLQDAGLWVLGVVYHGDQTHGWLNFGCRFATVVSHLQYIDDIRVPLLYSLSLRTRTDFMGRGSTQTSLFSSSLPGKLSAPRCLYLLSLELTSTLQYLRPYISLLYFTTT